MNFQKLIEISKALYSPKHELRTFHVSFLIYKNRINTIGINSPKTTPINLLNNKYSPNNEIVHQKGQCSEWTALNRAKNKNNIKFNKLTLVNVRIGRDGLVKNSRLCPFCRSLCEFFELKSIFYSTDFGEFEEYKL